MRNVVARAAADLKAGDEVFCVEEGMTHTRVVHTVKGNTVTYLHGERATYQAGIELLIAYDPGASEVKVDVPETRERPDLKQADAARRRASHLAESDPDYWNHYYGVLQRAESEAIE